MLNPKPYIPGLNSSPLNSTGTPQEQMCMLQGPLNAALCLTELLQCGTFVKEVIWSGTAGGSVQVGGVVNPGNCTASNSPVVGCSSKSSSTLFNMTVLGPAEMRTWAPRVGFRV